MGKLIHPKNHWKTCGGCGGLGGIKWKNIPKPLCESCLIKSTEKYGLHPSSPIFVDHETQKEN